MTRRVAPARGAPAHLLTLALEARGRLGLVTAYHSDGEHYFGESKSFITSTKTTLVSSQQAITAVDLQSAAELPSMLEYRSTETLCFFKLM